jgi:adenylylsulfate reductase subunit A
MSTTKGLFCAGDASGASSHKFSSGSHAEGRIAAKAAIRYIINEKPALKDVPADMIEELKARTFKPLEIWDAENEKTSDKDINPAYIRPKMFMFRLQKIMDEYAAGVSAQFSTNKAQLEKALELLSMLREDSAHLAAEDTHELMRAWENVHRLWQAEVHVRTILFREETRWPGYYYRADTPKMDEENWLAFANAKYDAASDEWEMIKRDVKYMFK